MGSALTWDKTSCEFDSWQCRIYIPCSLSPSGVTTPGQLWAMTRLPFGLPRLPCPQIDKTFYGILMLLVSCPGCPFTLVTPLLSPRLLGSLHGSLGTYGLTQKLCLKNKKIKQRSSNQAILEYCLPGCWCDQRSSARRFPDTVVRTEFDPTKFMLHLN